MLDLSKGMIDPTTTRGDLIVRGASAPAGRLAIGSNGKVLQSDGTDVSWQTPAGGTTVHAVQNFRLSLTTALSVTTADVTGATTIYLTPHNGSHIGLYNGATWDIISSAEVSLALGTLADGTKPYDVFAYNNAGVVTLEFLVWTSTTARATALVRQDGVWCKTGALTRRYVGTFMPTAVTTTEDSAANRFLFNADNPVERPLSVVDTTNTWTYTTANTWRQARASAANKVSFLVGLSINPCKFRAVGSGKNTGGAQIGEGVGIDITNGNSASVYSTSDGTTGSIAVSYYDGYPGIGVHAANWTEVTSNTGTTTFYGDNGNIVMLSGLNGTVWA